MLPLDAHLVARRVSWLRALVADEGGAPWHRLAREQMRAHASGLPRRRHYRGVMALLALGARDDALPEPLQQWTVALAAMPPLEMAAAPAAGEWSASVPLWTCPALLAPGARGGLEEAHAAWAEMLVVRARGAPPERMLTLGQAIAELRWVEAAAALPAPERLDALEERYRSRDLRLALGGDCERLAESLRDLLGAAHA